jgi:hypothetical protein
LLDREKCDKMSIENQLREKIRELQELHCRYDQDRNVTNSRLQELACNNEKLKRELCEKDRALTDICRENLVSCIFDLHYNKVNFKMFN